MMVDESTILNIPGERENLYIRVPGLNKNFQWTIQPHIAQTIKKTVFQLFLTSLKNYSYDHKGAYYHNRRNSTHPLC